MIRTFKTRFGPMEIDDSMAIHFPAGMIGFPQETLFVLLQGREGRSVSYLQSLRTPQLAFPVIDGGTVGPGYPEPNPIELALSVGIETVEPAVLVVVCAQGSPPRLYANLLAPIIVDAGERRAAQVVLDPARYSASVAIVRTPPETPADPPAPVRFLDADRDVSNRRVADADVA